MSEGETPATDAAPVPDDAVGEPVADAAAAADAVDADADANEVAAPAAEADAEVAAEGAGGDEEPFPAMVEVDGGANGTGDAVDGDAQTEGAADAAEEGTEVQDDATQTQSEQATETTQTDEPVAEPAETTEEVPSSSSGSGSSRGGGGGDESVFVKITVHPQGFTHTDAFSLRERVGKVKEVLGEKFKMPRESIVLRAGASVLGDEETLMMYAAAETVLELIMQIEYVEPGEAGASAYTMPEIIEVSLGPVDPSDPTSQEQIVLVKVMRENLGREKPFLGGFRHKLNSRTYHHAATQTLRKRRVKGVAKVHREAQTVEVRLAHSHPLSPTLRRTHKHCLYHASAPLKHTCTPLHARAYHTHALN